MNTVRKPITERFRTKFLVDGPTGCWNWIGCLATNGYGKILLGGTIVIGAHRASWLIHRGPIPVGLNVLHRCDNPRCVNPDHLWLGTHQDNITDASRKGRLVGNPSRGESCSSAKLTDRSVLLMRELYAGGMKRAELARKFGVGWTAVDYATSRKTWTHI